MIGCPGYCEQQAKYTRVALHFRDGCHDGSREHATAILFCDCSIFLFAGEGIHHQKTAVALLGRVLDRTRELNLSIGATVRESSCPGRRNAGAFGDLRQWITTSMPF